MNSAPRLLLGLSALGLALPAAGQMALPQAPFAASAISPEPSSVSGRAAATPSAQPSAPSAHPGEKETALPVREVALYKNGVAFFEQAGQIAGNELVRIDLTTAQLNDALLSLTAVDLGGGRVSSAGYDSTPPLGAQLRALAPGLGPDPTVLDLLRALKGTPVQIHSGAANFSGRLFNVEVRSVPSVKAGFPPTEKRFVSVISDSGALRTFELTPGVEVRLAGGDKEEIGRYLRVLASSHDPDLRHLTLEDRGAGSRELHISYLTAAPAWKSSYRLLFTEGADKSGTATLQGWAVVDNTSAEDWNNIQLTLVSGAPQSFIQQLSRPLNFTRPEVGFPSPGIPLQSPRANRGIIGSMVDPLGAAQSAPVSVNAASIGGGAGIQLQRAQPTVQAQTQPVTPVTNYEEVAGNTSAPQATTVNLDDLFEYRLSRPITLRRGESATIPILQTSIQARHVTLWRGDRGSALPMRALWLTNTSPLLLDRGSVTILDSGLFGGEGQVELMHPNERKLVAYASDESIQIRPVQSPKTPDPYIRSFTIADGTLTVHMRVPEERDFIATNTGSAPRTVVFELPRNQKWRVDPDFPQPAEILDNSYRFELEVPANGTNRLKFVQSHSHPNKFQLAQMSEKEILTVLKNSGNNADLQARLQPFLDARRQLDQVVAKLKDIQAAGDSVKWEEKRIRENMASLTGNPGERSLSRRYADEMNKQEDKMEDLLKQKDALLQQQSSIQKDLAARAATIQAQAVLHT